MINVHSREFTHRRKILVIAVAFCTALSLFAESAKDDPTYGRVFIGLLFLPSAYLLTLLLGHTVTFLHNSGSGRTFNTVLLALFYLSASFSLLSLVIHSFVVDIGIDPQETSLFYAQAPAGLFVAAGLLKLHRRLPRCP